MAKNTGKGHRQGIVSNRTQGYNSKTGQYIKRDTQTGQFVSCKDSPYKNIRRETNAKNSDNQKTSGLPKEKPNIKIKK